MFKKSDVLDIYNLSPMQEGILFHYLSDRDSTAYVEQSVYTVSGHLDIEVFELTFNNIIRKYDILRTVFVYKKVKAPMQVVLKERTGSVYYRDISGIDEPAREEVLESYKKEDREKGFDLSKDIPMRLSVFRVASDSYKIVWTNHHIVMDGWCTGILFGELARVYPALKAGETVAVEPAAPYSRYISWLRKQDKKAARQYWQDYSGGVEKPTIIPRSGGNENREYRLAEHCFSTGPQLASQLETIARKEQSSKGILLRAVWGILLMRYNNSGDVFFNTIVSGRPPEVEGIEEMVGLFINSIPVRVSDTGDVDFNGLLRRLQNDAVSAKPFEYFSLAEIQKLSGLDNNLSDHTMGYQDLPGSTAPGDEKGEGFRVVDYEFFEQTHYDLNCIIDGGGDLNIRFSYNAGAFDQSFVQRMAGHFMSIVSQVADDPFIGVNQIDIVTTEEKRRILDEFNYSATISVENEKTIHGWFREQAVKWPEREAVVLPAGENGERRVLTYGELDRQSDSLAAQLKEEGVRSGSIAPVMADYSLETVLKILAILKCGAAYLPIDAGYPEKRVDYILKDAGASFSSGNSDIAYVIYTSGTTGEPRGVAVSHRGVVNYASWRIDEMRYSTGDVCLQMISPTFDGFGANFFPTLLSGGKMVMVPGEKRLDGNYVATLCHREQVTQCSLVPPMYQMILDNAAPGQLDTLRFVVLAAEKAGAELVRASRSKLPRVELINEYGPTETTIGATAHRNMTPESLSIIGKPVTNCGIYILDQTGHLQPVGIPGAIHISGNGLAHGYLNQPELTATKFLPNSKFKIQNSKLYNSGDMGKWLADGTVEFLGRIDHQVKIRGFRVDLSEIESRLTRRDDITGAVVMAREDEKGKKTLCAYFVGTLERTPSSEELIDYLSGSLPEYMVPSFFVSLEQIPRTINGKTDRAALPAPTPETAAQYIAPTNPVETRLVDVIREVFNVPRVGLSDNFFHLGGDSIKAIQVAAQLNKYGLRLEIRDMFAHPVLSFMAKQIHQPTPQTQPAPPPAEPRRNREEIDSLLAGLRDKSDVRDVYGLSPMQEGMLFNYIMDPSSSAYIQQTTYTLAGELDIRVLELTFKTIIQKYDILRTVFLSRDVDKPVQVVMEKRDWRLDYRDISSESETDAGEILERYLREDRERNFELSGDVPLRIAVFRVSSRSFKLVWTSHHIVIDGWCSGILFREIIQHYFALKANGDIEEKPAIPYSRYIRWLETQDKEKGLQYWTRYLEGVGNPTTIPRPGDHSVQDSTGYVPGEHRFTIDGGLTGDIEALARSKHCSINIILRAVWGILLTRYNNSDDVVFNTIVSGRPPEVEGIEEMVGLFINSIPVRVTVDSSYGFSRLVEQLRDHAVEATRYEYFSLAEIQARTDLKNTLTDHLMVFQNFPFDDVMAAGKGQEDGGFRVENVDAFEQTGYDFNCIIDRMEELEVRFSYNALIFQEPAMRRMGGHFMRILSQAMANPSILLNQIDIMTGEEKQGLLETFNQTEVAYPSGKTIHQLYSEQAAANPDAIAVRERDNTRFITYSQLNERSLQWVRLLREQGVEPGDIVVLMADRSIDTVIALLAILNCGAAYLPIDPDYPRERIDYIISDANPKIVLYPETLPFDNLPPVDFGQDVECGNPGDIAYVIYTSGSTGRPKGVMVEHRNVVRLVKNSGYIDFSRPGGILQTGAMDFDASTFEVWGSLLNGWTLYLGSKEDILNPVRLKEIVSQNSITTLWMTAPLFNQMIDADEEIFQTLENLIVGGDALSPSHINRVRLRFPSLRVINGYGPTENTTFSTTHIIEKEYIHNIPIGRPIANSTCLIVDSRGNPVPIGVPGELWVGGDGVARGYLNNPQLTNKSFITLQAKSFWESRTLFTKRVLAAGGNIYKTGDLACWLEGGDIQFLGRIDQQLKVRGFRIEPGEIENRILERPGVHEAVVIAREDNVGEKYLCAYVVGGDEGLEEYLRETLPGYMIPSFFVKMDKIPLTSNGKVDRRALPGPEFDKKGEKGTGEIIERLRRLWAGILGIDAARIHSGGDFFRLGGHSLKAVSLLNGIYKTFNRRFEIKQLFTHSTLAGQARLVRESDIIPFMQIEKIPEAEYYPLSYTQKRLWVLQKINPDSALFNIPMLLPLEGPLEIGTVRWVWEQLVRRHESLRTCFSEQDDEVVQVIAPMSETFTRLEEVDLSILTPEQKKSGEEQLIQQEMTASFDLYRSPLHEAKLIKWSEKEYYFILRMHHILSDGWSMNILREEFLSLYRSRLHDREITLPSLRVQYKDFAHWQNRLLGDSRRMAQARETWRNVLSGPLPVLQLPYDATGGDGDGNPSGSYRVAVPTAVTNELKAIASRHNASLFMVLLAGFNLLLSSMRGQEDIVIGIPGAARQHEDLKNIVGMFVNTMILKNHVRPGETFQAFLERVQQNTLAVLEFQDYPMELICEELQVPYPSLNVFFNMVNIGGNPGPLNDFDPRHIPRVQDAKMELTLYVSEFENGIDIDCHYFTRRFQPGTVEEILGTYLRILQNITADPTLTVGGYHKSRDKTKKKLKRLKR